MSPDTTSLSSKGSNGTTVTGLPSVIAMGLPLSGSVGSSICPRNVTLASCYRTFVGEEPRGRVRRRGQKHREWGKGEHGPKRRIVDEASDPAGLPLIDVPKGG